MYPESTCPVKYDCQEPLRNTPVSVTGHSMCVIAPQMELGNDTTLSHAVRLLCIMSDPSVTFISTRKTHAEEVN